MPHQKEMTGSNTTTIAPNNSGQSPLYRQLSQNEESEEDSEDEVVQFQSPPRNARNSSTAAATARYCPTPRLDNHPILMAPRTEQMYLHDPGTGAGSVVDMVDSAASDSTPFDILTDSGVNSTNAQDDETATGHIMGARKPMGACRKFCFCLSIFVCFASVVLFLWGLPCNTQTMSCPVRGGAFSTADEDAAEAQNWIRVFERKEFKGVVSVSRRNIIFMYRADRTFEQEANDHHQQQHGHQSGGRHNGIISLMAKDGGISWYYPMAEEPSNIDCSVIDVDLNGTPDCLVIDEYGQLGAIDPLSGTWMWHIHQYKNQSGGGGGDTGSEKAVRGKAIDLLDFPLILPDIIDNDRVNDLLLVTSLEQAHHNNFLFVSGAHGSPLGNATTLSSCEFVHKLQIERDTANLLFNCINNETEVTKVWPLSKLFQVATQREFPAEKLRLAGKQPQHKFYGQRRNTQSQRNIYSNGIAELTVENAGNCPANCKMEIAVRAIDKDAALSPSTTVVNGSAMYGMVPAVFVPRTNGEDSRLSGFVIKYWEWEVPGNVNWTTEEKDSKMKERRTVPGNGGRVKREEKQPRDSLYNLVHRRLKEHVLLITFNGTGQPHRVTSLGQSDITQFCRELNGVATCQPDVNFQENSVTIAADRNGFKDRQLISYYSTYEEELGKERWMLRTYVSQRKLASLYDT